MSDNATPQQPNTPVTDAATPVEQPPAQVTPATPAPAASAAPTPAATAPASQQTAPAAPAASASTANYVAPTAKPASPSPLGQQNVFSVLSVILAFIFPIMGVIFGHIGLSQIKKTREPGRGLAITGLTVGYVFTVLAVIGFFIWIALLSALSYWTMGYEPHSMIHDLENF